MKLLKRRKFWSIVSLIGITFACNNHTSKNSSGGYGKKNPVIITPTKKDTTLTKNTKTGSPNEEYNQHKIDSIKNKKIKPK